MKPLAAAVQTLPARPGSREAVTLPFPVGRRSLARLRKLRDRLFLEGKLDIALRVAQEVVRVDPGRESLFRLGFLLRESGRYREALKHFRDALRFRNGAQYLVPEIHLHTAYSYLLMGRRKEMGQALKRAYATRWKPRLEPKLHHSFGNALLARGRYREAFREFVRAEEGYRSAIDRGRAIVNQGVSVFRLGDYGQAGLLIDRAIRIHERGGHAAESTAARAIRSNIYLDQGELPRALAIMQRVARSFRTLGKPAMEAAALQDCGYIAGLLKLWPKSRAYHDRAIGLLSSQAHWRALSCAHAGRAAACAYQEDFDQATESLRRAEALSRGKRDWVVTLHLCRAHARIASLFGNWVTVRRWSRRAERVARKAGDLTRVVEFRNLRAEAEAQLGRRRAAFHAQKTARRIEALRGVSSNAMQEVRRRAAKLALCRMPLLIVGEDGTGAIDLAREIHAAGPRRKAPCVVVPCEQLSFPESDLAGHVDGAWTGAGAAAQGYVQKAEGGTLILDRLDELSPEAQRVLLRIVEGRARSVGAGAEQIIDIRVIATCQRSDRLIDSLLKRLESGLLRVPSLQERPTEIPTFVERFLGGRRQLTCDAMALLAAQAWKAGLSQLQAVVERLAAVSHHQIGVKLVQRILKTPESALVEGFVYKKRPSRQMACQPS